MAAITGAIVGIIFVSSLFLQQVLGSSPVVTGVEFLPLAAAITLGAAAASHVLGHVGPKAVIVGGLLIVALGSTLLAGMDSDPSYLTDVLPGFLVVGLGTGLLFVAISIVAMDGIDHEHAGLASGVMMTGHEVGAALGVAALTAVAGDLTTQAGLVEAYPRVFAAMAVAMVVVSALAALACPACRSRCRPADTDTDTAMACTDHRPPAPSAPNDATSHLTRKHAISPQPASPRRRP